MAWAVLQAGLVLHQWERMDDNLPRQPWLLSAALLWGKVDSRRLHGALAKVLPPRGVKPARRPGAELQHVQGGLDLRLGCRTPLPSAARVSQVVLAAGAFWPESSWPSLVSQLRHSWAGC